MTIFLGFPLSARADEAQFSGLYFTAKQSNLGMPVLLKAQLVDASGDPIPEATIYFDIYHDGAWHVINEDDGGYITDSTGAASVYYYVDPTLSAGDYQIRARFDGNTKSESTVLEQTLETNEAGITFALYLNGDNNLESYAIDDFYNELYPHGTNEDVNYIVLFDGDGSVYYNGEYWTGTRMFIVTPEAVAAGTYPYQDWGEQNMGAQSTLQNFVETAFTDFPAENNVLVIWDHGNGWYSEPESKTLTADDTSTATQGTHVELPIPSQVAARLSSKKAAVFDAAEKNREYKGVSYDDSSAGDYLGLTELSGALEQAGVIVDVLAIDACLMGTVEVAYELKDVANFFVASAETISVAGFDYDDLGDRIDSGSASTARDMAYQMVASYKNYYLGDTYNATLSAWDLTEMASLFSALENLSTAFLAQLEQIPYGESTALRSAAEDLIDDTSCYDLGSLAYHIQQEISDTQVAAAAQALESQIKGVARVNYWIQSGTRWGKIYSDMTGMTGLSLYWPLTSNFNPNYVDENALSFANQSWNKVIRLIYDSTAPTGTVQWVQTPHALSDSSISMESFTGTDQFVVTYNRQTYYLDNTVYYQFTFTQSPTGGSGGSDSDNRYESTVYSDEGLEPNHQYCYTVYAHDGAGNETDATGEACAVTLAQAPAAISLTRKNCNQVLAAWDPGNNPAGTEYYCENMTTGNNSGWITDAEWVSAGLAINATYSFRVKARNSENIETDWVSLGDFELGPCAGDINTDGVVNIADAILCLQVAAGLAPEGIDKSKAIDAELQVGLDEALYILQINSELR
ncbi:clostripain-related cysteine peptidase [Desulfatibacillum aliphaticivorans]|uniref:clostripain-related cysteine peptidase n=1 Tax=Desulfatibacillum aliphaticivorans TaxID=218208 RepID=UPI002009EEE8|nr:clostripain-related cysteine peptidase [Desulfatibacillum aliphaticivorans]